MPGNQVLVSERNAVMETYTTGRRTAKKSHGVSLTCNHKNLFTWSFKQLERTCQGCTPWSSSIGA
jgi:dolichyl-phosphate-mannose--protein O-mannosyl transferase